MHKFALAALVALLVPAAHARGEPHAAWLLSQGGGNGVEVWQSPKEESGYLWRLVTPKGATLAEKPQPTLRKGYSVNYGRCKVRGVLRDDVLAIVRHADGKEWSGDVQAIWQASPEAKAFVPLAPKGVTCLNEAYGV